MDPATVSSILDKVTVAQAGLAQAYAVVRRGVFAVAGVVVGAVPPRPGDTYVRPAWLTGILQRRGVLPKGVYVAEAEVRSFDGSRGLVGATNKIHVKYAASGKAALPDDLPATFIFKTNPGGYGGRLACLNYLNYREAQFYGDPISRSFALGTVPNVYYAVASPLLGEYVLVMEDVPAKRDVVPCNLIHGNQVWGVPESFTAPHSSLETLEAVFLTAARIHAPFWGNKEELLAKTWMKGVGEYSEKPSFWTRVAYEKRLSQGRRAWEATKAQLASGVDRGVKFSEGVTALLEKEMYVPFDDFKAIIDRLPCAFTHGDFHAGNMFVAKQFSGGDADIVLFDWPEAGISNPLSELAQTLISDVRPEVMANVKDLLRTYHAELTRLGITVSYETCWEAMIVGGLTRWAWLMAILTQFPIPAHFLQYLNDQIQAFIDLTRS